MPTVHRAEFQPRPATQPPMTKADVLAILQLLRTESQVLREERAILRRVCLGIRAMVEIEARDRPTWRRALRELDSALNVTGP